MSAALARRLAALEQNLRPADSVPVFVIGLDAREIGDPVAPLFIAHEGRRWTQGASESREAFIGRAKADALASYTHAGPRSVLFLVVQRPSLSREQWLDKYHGRRTQAALPGADDYSLHISGE